ncbi:MAG: class II aldolase/adducin family protein [Elusimicrobiaceae bacterium]|nr:class II aldolase/adducin family protein [Elusimicrobiaceae bacterium]
MTEAETRERIVETGRRLHAAGFVAANDGNISARLPGGFVLATPTGVSKGFMRASELCVTDMSGRQVSGPLKPSSELKMHLLIYSLRPDIGAIVHAHPVTATGFAAAGLNLDQPVIAETAVTLGPVALAPYGTPGTDELADALRPLVPGHDAVLLANHGAVTYAADLERALFMMESMEHCARITLVTRQLGRTSPIPPRQLEKLAALRRAGEPLRQDEEAVISAVTAALAEFNRRCTGA